jgi:quercetin dioxygenase-like cupin family protein
MDTTIFKQFTDLPTKEIAPGYSCKIVHTDSNTINFIEVKAGAVSAIHQHPHHQCAFVIEGQFELTVNGVPQILDANTYAVIPGGVWHGGRAITDCKLIDVFNPVREDFKNL